MLGEHVIEHASASPVNLGPSSETLELPAETYEKLRRIAAEYLRSERAGHTLQPTALLHEAFLRVSNVLIILGTTKHTSSRLQHGQCGGFWLAMGSLVHVTKEADLQ